MELTTIQKVTCLILPLLFAITLHEVAHGWVASWFGDQTARLSGRLTINPIKHIDPVGTLLVPIAMFVFTGFIFGWAKPVPVDPRNLHHPRRDMAFVALAGPISNLLMALFWALIAKLGAELEIAGNVWLGVPLVYMGGIGIMINIWLGVLNLIPLPPLDGGNVLKSILSPRLAYRFSFIEPYSFFILVLLMMTGFLANIMLPFVQLLMGMIAGLVGLS